ncbi:IclR family transcriptional regulator [Agromyces archimandritae]|uniref:IclR family transcriptional regulator n=1 Tax=Agromyces archimandritae TaxID=2781962 RepID=A0A975FKW3_9MICO|nr:IclR family transcriptional regulator [Agromyces archimandritae]QTX03839.1 IclR family transcriptional regulator [Agromyces archimandritae]
MAGRTADPGDGVLARAARLLGAFDDDHDELPLAELAARSGLARSTVHRLAVELERLGFLARTPAGWTIGAVLWELGERSPLSMRLREVALPHLGRLYEAIGENVHLAVLDGPAEHAEALYVARLSGPRAIPTVSRMGGRHPLYATGVGKALLEGVDADFLDRYLAAVPRERETVHTVLDAATLRRQIDEARERGWATTRQEMTLGNVSVAAPIPQVLGLPPAAVGVVAHIARADERRLGRLVVDAARQIAADLR